MKTLSHLIIVAALLAGGVAWADDPPKIHFDRTVYDFGATSLVESLTGTFTFQNTGGGVLKLEKPKPSCGCTVAQVSTNSLKAGEKGEIVFTLRVGTAANHVHKEIVVSSNDPQTPSLALGIQVDTKSVFQAMPQAVSMGEMPLGTTKEGTVTLKRVDGRKLTVTKVEPSNDLISVKVGPTPDADPHSARLQIAIKAGGVPRYFSEQVRVSTDDSIGAALSIFVNAHFMGDIRLEPEALTWGMPAPEEANEDIDVILSRYIKVHAVHTDQPLVVSNVTTTVKNLKVEMETIEKDQEYKIQATLPERLKDSVQGVIRFDTNLKSMPKVEVPVEINVWRE